MKKTVKVQRHNRSDGAVVEAHDRIIESEDDLTESIKKRKRENEQANLLETFYEEK